MRKQDYLTIAKMLREQLRTARDNIETSKQGPGNSSQWARGDELETRTILFAREFAECASVDKSAFLRACGIE